MRLMTGYDMGDDTMNITPITGLPRNETSQQSGDSLVAIAESQGDVTAHLRGRLTAASVAELARQVLEPIKRAGIRNVTIDGSEVKYCDGAGIGLIGEVRRTASV